MLDRQRMQQLGLLPILDNDELNDSSFQQVMAKQLRDLTFRYLKGELHHIVPDGSQVEILRANLIASRLLDEFVSQQAPNQAWATDVELTLLTELLGTNFAVHMTGGGQSPTILTANPQETKPTVVLYNDSNTHWSPQINGKKSHALGDGNCGYNAVAQALKALHAKKPQAEDRLLTSHAAHLIWKQERDGLKGSIQSAQEAERAYEQSMQRIAEEEPTRFEAMQQQMKTDYLYALQLALDDLPDENGLTATPVGQLVKLTTDLSYVTAVANDLALLSKNEEQSASQHFRLQ